MSSLALRVSNLSKRYKLGTIGYGSLQHDLGAWWARVRGKEDPNSRIGEEVAGSRYADFWALADVNFEVTQGDRVGIVGRNGAGKSTLLKILSRVTSPSSGQIKVRGRIASLLEVGTGFHPELSGRENIFLNGAILGMKRTEIQDKFDEIVSFAGVDQFVDTPVKRYSSGMYVRLAFSVAAHLDSEILIVDEVLAVGDAEFQRKCLGKMNDISKGQGRTILFVSHQLSSLQALCNKGIGLSRGRLLKSGTMAEVTEWYGRDLTPKAKLNSEWVVGHEGLGDSTFAPLAMYLQNSSGTKVTTSVKMTEKLAICVESEIREHSTLLSFGLVFYASDSEQPLFWSCLTDRDPDSWPSIEKGKNSHICVVPEHLLNEGLYRVELVAFLHMRKWILEPGRNAPSIMIEVQGGFGSSPYWYEKRAGLVAPVLAWVKT